MILEGSFPLIVCTTIYFLTPESPRYEIMRGREDKARRIIARYQTTEGDTPNHPLCNVMVMQIKDSLAFENRKTEKSGTSDHLEEREQDSGLWFLFFIHSSSNGTVVESLATILSRPLRLLASRSLSSNLASTLDQQLPISSSRLWDLSTLTDSIREP